MVFKTFCAPRDDDAKICEEVQDETQKRSIEY